MFSVCLEWRHLVQNYRQVMKKEARALVFDDTLELRQPTSSLERHEEIMATAGPYGNDAERRQHSKAIRMLAEDLGVPEEKIRSVYEDIYSSIREGARIRDYLVILVSRNVRDSIRKGQYWSR